MKTLYIKTFGCQMNVYDSSRMQDALKVQGYDSVSNPEKADIIILNTCHIREKAADKLFSEIGRMAEIKRARKEKNLPCLIIVCGCVVQAMQQELLEKAPAVDFILGPQSYHLLPKMVAEFDKKHHRFFKVDFTAMEKFDALPPIQTSGVSAFLAVQEGCDNFCSYCVVPYTRGAEYTRPFESIMAEAERLVALGAKEITLLGQNVNCWQGKKEKGQNIPMDFGDLLKEVAGIKGLLRLRYMTSYPSKITKNVIKQHGELENLMPYIHIPVQSGSDSVLKAMNRKYTAKEYLNIIQEFKSARPDIAFSSDFIVGFPGETNEDFKATLQVVDKVQYASSFSFKYSPRPGTPASLMKNQIPLTIKTNRLTILQEKLLGYQKAFNLACVGKKMKVLFVEKNAKNQWQGYTPYMQIVHFESNEDLKGKEKEVLILNATTISLTGGNING